MADDYIAGILSANDRTRAAALRAVHPVYGRSVNLWNIGLDAYDGAGGFLDGTYLWQFPRETQGDYNSRRAQARYHNYAEALVDIYVRHITRSVERSTSDAALTDWWLDVDGRGGTIDEMAGSVLSSALAAGHAGILVDKASEAPMGPSRADDPNRPYLVILPSPAILDWRLDRRGLAAVKLAMEPAPTSFAVPPAEGRPDFLLWDREMFARFDWDGKPLAQGAHGLGVVPLEVVRPKPSRRHPFIGKALVAPSLIRAMFNRASEEDVVLRDQAFSLFVVSLPMEATADDVEAVKAQMNHGVGTTTVSVVKGVADFKTADMGVPVVLRDNQSFLVTELYRMSHLRFDRGSLQAQSGEALRIQRQELEQTLVSMAAMMREAELAIVGRYYDWTTTDGQAATARAQVEIVYPTDFAMRDLEEELAGFAQATAMGLGQTASVEIKTRVVNLILPDLAPDTLEVVKAEIAALAEAAPDPDEMRRERAKGSLRAAGVEVIEDDAAA